MRFHHLIRKKRSSKHVKLSESEENEAYRLSERVQKYLENTEIYETKILKLTNGLGTVDFLILYTPYRFHREFDIRTNPSEALYHEEFKWICELMQSNPNRYSATHINMHINENSFDKNLKQLIAGLSDMTFSINM